MQEGKPQYKAAEFREGHYIQVEGAGIVKGAKNRELAERFMEFMLSEGFQSEVPLNQYMFPVNQDVGLPGDFNYALMPATALGLDPALVDEKQEEWISEWERIVSSS